MSPHLYFHNKIIEKGLKLITVVSREVGLNCFFFKVKRFFANIFGSMCRMTLIFFRALRCGLRQPSRYIEHGHTMRKKFFKSIWKKFSLQKHAFFKHVSTQFWEWIFQKSKLFYVSCPIIHLTCRMTLIFVLA